MKRFLSSLTILLGLFLLSTCDEIPFDAQDSSFTLSLKPRYLRPGDTSIEVYYTECQRDLYVNSAGTPWKFEGLPNWITASPKSKQNPEPYDYTTATLTIMENPLAETRSAVFYLVSTDPDWEYRVPIQLSQYGATPSIVPGQKNLTVTGTVGSVTLPVESNCNWTLGKPSSDTWFTATIAQDYKGVDLTFQANSTGTSRSSWVSMEYSSTTVYAYITQRPANITSTEESLDFPASMSSGSFTFESEADWQAESADYWILFSPTSGGAGKNTLSVQVLGNSGDNRTGYIYLGIGGNKLLEVPVTQAEGWPTFQEQEFEFPAKGGQQVFHVKSYGYWSFDSSKPDWMDYPGEGKGSGDETLTLTVQENFSTSEREGVLTLYPSKDQPQELHVVQVGKAFQVDATEIQFSTKSETYRLAIVSEDRWTASTSDAWISLSPLQGSGNATLEISVQENTSAEDRTGLITLQMGQNAKQISVVQQGRYLKVSNTALSLNSKGDPIKVFIYTNEPWTAQVAGEVQWLHLDKTSGTESCELVLTADDNPSAESRTAYVDVTGNTYSPVHLTITQDERYLTVSPSTLSFFAKGGQSTPITINTDGTFEVSTSASWLTPSSTNSKVFTVTATANPTFEERTGIITVRLTDVTSGTVEQTITVTQEGNTTKSFTVNGVSFTMVLVKGGTFWMGAQSLYSGDPNYDVEAAYEESPVHQVTLDDYYIGQTEVTQSLWTAVMGSNPSEHTGENYPVDNICWNDCQTFVDKLTELTGWQFCLPTEAQWEFAARGGNKSKGYKYSGSSLLDNVAWFHDNYKFGTQFVATKAPNELELYDMSGNVEEWCCDGYANYSGNAQTNPVGGNYSTYYVIRGGDYYSEQNKCRVSTRSCFEPSYASLFFGLRLGLSTVPLAGTYSAVPAGLCPAVR